jgi:hypothetical protein
MPSELYASAMTLSDARSTYFQLSGFDADGGYSARWVRLKVGPASLAFPNTRCRVRAVQLHDIHHVLTEYETTWTGEAEISAWEIASGCRDHYVAWLLDWGALAIGLFLAPKRVWKAFVRGRRSRNLYNGQFDEAVLTRTVGELRRELAIPPEAPPATPADALSFAFWSAVSAAVTFGPWVLGAGVVAAAYLLLR